MSIRWRWTSRASQKEFRGNRNEEFDDKRGTRKKKRKRERRRKLRGVYE